MTKEQKSQFLDAYIGLKNSVDEWINKESKAIEAGDVETALECSEARETITCTLSGMAYALRIFGYDLCECCGAIGIYKR